MAKKTGPQLVRIEWRDPESDWPWFYLIKIRGEWLHLQGADYPDGSARHDGDCFWVHKSDVRTMSSNALGEGRERGILREASSSEAATSTDGLEGKGRSDAG